MAVPSVAPRPPARDESDGAAGSDTPPRAYSVAGVLARVKTICTEKSDGRVVQLVAGKVFLLRVASALIALGSQVLLARFMGLFEFGIYIYVWTWVLMIGALSDVGLSSAARRFIPEYNEFNQPELLRGFLTGSRWLAFAVASAIGIVGAVLVTLLKPHLDDFTIIPLYLACATIPIYGLVQVQFGIAQSYDWPNLALTPFFICRQIVITALIGACWVFGAPTDAVSAMLIAVAATYAVTIGQSVVLNRRLKTKVPAGPRRYAVKTWYATSIPIFIVEGFYLMLTYVDILTLEHFRSPREVAVYYAAARLLAIVAFVYFAIAGATTHKFTRYYVNDDKERLRTFFSKTARWTFWPSFAICAGILALGKPLLSLFGAGFTGGYPVMFILAIGLLARAAVGPAERLLNMLGESEQCAITYAIAFAINLTLCVLLIPRTGIEGAGLATSTALVIESILLFLLAKRRLGFHFFVIGDGDRAE